MSAAQLLQAARDHGIMIATAESCTGGLIIAALTEVAGSSDVVDRGFVTYSNSAKQDMLGVSASTLQTYGAVSEEVAAEMAQGALKRADAGLAIAVTGIAGPGGSEFKPEGRVCFGLADTASVRTQTVEFGAVGRAQVRKATVEHAIAMMLAALKAPSPPQP
ncbi:CinA family protein [Roseinatronobacter sp.]|uniref:CinA family protein n=1 Tax=Roseinatronobacter sp. TaxID=1945755 RepID=UPI0025D7CDEB|nr:CinA family protein [Rhodobaca sp.]